MQLNNIAGSVLPIKRAEELILTLPGVVSAKIIESESGAVEQIRRYLRETVCLTVHAGDNVIATIPIEPLATVPTGDFISRWTNAEYLALQKRRTTDNGKMAKDWDNVTSDPQINLNKKKTQTLKSNLVADGILTQARADEIFS